MQSRFAAANKPLKVGITGGIGSGKTVVSRIFSVLGIPLYNADDRAKWLLAYDPQVRKGLISLFGEEVFRDGELQRKYISQKVFNDAEKLAQLNGLVHPRVGEDFLDWLQEHREAPYILKEAALLYEANSYKDLDRIITVYSPVDLRIKRLLKRDTHRTEEDIRRIMANQLSDEEKVKRADHVIYNDDERMLIPQVLELDALFRKR